MMPIDVIEVFIKYYLGLGGVGHVGVGWDGSCRGVVGSCRGGVGSCRGGVGHAGVGWVM